MYQVREEPLGYEKDHLPDVVPLGQPYAIMIDPCGACNFSCCFCPCNNADILASVRHEMMSYEMFQRVVDGLGNFPQKIPVIDLYGLGEPLLNRDLPRMIRYLKQSECCRMIRTTTNGSLLTPLLSEELAASGLDYIKISIEGLDSEKYQSQCGVSIDFNGLVENIRYLYDVSRGHMRTGTKIISSAFCDETDRQRYLDIFSPITDYTYIRNIQWNWAEFENMVIPAGSADGVYCSNKIPHYEICSYPLTHMIIHANGDIGVCCYDWKHGTVYSSIRESSAVDAWRSEALRRIRIMHLSGKRSELPFCASCVRKGYDNIDRDANAIIKILENEY